MQYQKLKPEIQSLLEKAFIKKKYISKILMEMKAIQLLLKII